MAWYQLIENLDDITIEFVIPDNREFTYDTVRSDPLPARVFKNKKVVIGGKGALWMYAHAALECHRAGAVEISVSNARDHAAVRIFPHESPGTDIREPIFLSELSSEGKILITVTNRMWNISDLGAVQAACSAFKENSPYVLLCQGPNWLVSFVAILCHLKHAKTIEYFDARKGSCINLLTLASRDWVRPDYLKRKKIAVGIVGDPNSGKSVFSAIFQAVLSKRGMVTWLADSDMASPTPKWYFDSLGQGDKQITSKAKTDRDVQKKPWNHQMELIMASNIKNMKKFQDVLVVDLPGGIHGDKSTPIRIPDGREVMFSELDSIIIIVREDKPEAEQGWLKALEERNLQNKIIAIITSAEPNGDFTVKHLHETGGILRGVVTGLNRDTVTLTVDKNPRTAQLNDLAEKLIWNKQDRNLATLLDITAFAAQKHVFQKRRDRVTPYINHPIDVARFLTNEVGVHDISVIGAALLHDTLEDTDTTYEEIKSLYGEAIADIVAEVTDDRTMPKGERKLKQIEKACSLSVSAQYVKFGDCVCNLRSMIQAPPAWEKERKIAYINWLRAVIDELAYITMPLKIIFTSDYDRAIAKYSKDEGVIPNDR